MRCNLNSHSHQMLLKNVKSSVQYRLTRNIFLNLLYCHGCSINLKYLVIIRGILSDGVILIIFC